MLRGAVLVVAAMVSSVVWSPRPQIMSLVMLALLSWLMHIYQEKRSRISLYSILLVFILWGNLHGGYVLGVIYLGAFLAGELLDEFGWNDYGECLTIADKKEVWHLEILGPGRGKTGSVWVAQRVPDEHVAVNANASTIKEIDMEDREHFIASKNI